MLLYKVYIIVRVDNIVNYKFYYKGGPKFCFRSLLCSRNHDPITDGTDSRPY